MSTSTGFTEDVAYIRYQGVSQTSDNRVEVELRAHDGRAYVVPDPGPSEARVNWYEKELVPPWRFAVRMINDVGPSDVKLSEPFGPDGDGVGVDAVRAFWYDDRVRLEWGSPPSVLEVREYRITVNDQEYRSTTPRIEVSWVPPELLTARVDTWTRYNLLTQLPLRGTDNDVPPPQVSVDFVVTSDNVVLRAQADGLNITAILSANGETVKTVRGKYIDHTLDLYELHLLPDTDYDFSLSVQTVLGTETRTATQRTRDLPFVEYGALQRAGVWENTFYHEEGLPVGIGSERNTLPGEPTHIDTYIRTFSVVAVRGPDEGTAPSDVRLLARRFVHDPWTLVASIAPQLDESVAPWGTGGIDAPPQGTQTVVHTTAGAFREVRVEADTSYTRLAWQIDYARTSRTDAQISLRSARVIGKTLHASWSYGTQAVLSWQILEFSGIVFETDTVIEVELPFGTHELRWSLTNEFNHVTTGSSTVHVPLRPSLAFDAAYQDLRMVYVGTKRFPVEPQAVVAGFWSSLHLPTPDHGGASWLPTEWGICVDGTSLVEKAEAAENADGLIGFALDGYPVVVPRPDDPDPDVCNGAVVHRGFYEGYAYLGFATRFRGYPSL